MPELVITTGARTGLFIPDYELFRPIGRGAYGEVWLARNVTGSWVALKIVHRAAFDHDRPFEREFEGIKRFEPISRSDPSQVAILHVGLGDGFFYYVMELADAAAAASNQCSVGQYSVSDAPSAAPITASQLNTDSLITEYSPRTLKRLLNDRGALPAQECLTIALSLTRALAPLHGHGLVHRDVKPSNVIFVNGQAKLADIGLVTSVDATRSFVGTEGYLPPEGAGTPQADLYSLGKMLYEMSTGCDRKEFPALPPDIATRPDRDALAELNAIIVRACQVSPRERYASAEEMRADLELLQRGRSLKRRRTLRQYYAAGKKVGLIIALVALGIVLPRFFRTGANDPVQSANPEVTKNGADDYPESKNSEVLRLVAEGFRAIQRGGDERAGFGLSCFNKALAIEPNYLPALYGAADADIRLGSEPGRLEHMRKMKNRMMDLYPSWAEAVGIAAFVKWCDGQYQEALKGAKEAIRLPAACPQMRAYRHLGYGYFLQCMGDAEGARDQYQIGQTNYRDDPVFEDHIGQTYFMQTNFAEAMKFFQLATNNGPTHLTAYYFIAQISEELGDFDRAIDEREEIARSEHSYGVRTKDFYEGLRRAVEHDRERGYWRYRLERMWEESPGEFYKIACLYARLGKMDEAYKYLQRAGEQHDFNLTGMMFDLSWDHNADRFRAVATNIGLIK